MSIEIYVNNLPVTYKFFTFSGGEVSVKLDTETLPISYVGSVHVKAFLKSSNDIMTLLLLVDAIKQATQSRRDKNCEWTLDMPYIPYARQDRVCDSGESLSVKVYADLINSLGFDRVTVQDPHSEVSTALLNNVVVQEQHKLVLRRLAHRIRLMDVALVSPDAGAQKKIFKLAKSMGGLDVFTADKVRDTSTGQIIKTSISETDFKGRNLLIVDDIFDGGFTFLKLAELLKERNAGFVELFVTHGIFSKGVDIADGLLDAIYAENIWEENVKGRNTKGILKYKVKQ